MANEKNLVINQNETFLEVVSIANSDNTTFDLTNYIVQAQMRRGYLNAYYQDMHPIIDADPTTGNLTLNLNYLETGALRYGRWVYDVFITNLGTTNTIRVVGGIVEVVASSTRTTPTTTMPITTTTTVNQAP